MGYNLSLLPPRGVLLPLGERQKLMDDFRKETNLDGPCEVTNCTGERVASAFDTQTVEDCFRDGEFDRGEYENFCTAHHLTPVANSESSYRAARLFLDYKWGQDVCLLKLPPTSMQDEVCEAYRLIVDFARRHELLVHDPQLG